MTDKRKRAYRFGLTSEKLARIFLSCKGYRIIAERYRNTYGEIDIVATKGDTLIAIEVKARKTFAECEVSITPHKQRKIERALQGLLAGQGKFAGLVTGSHPNIRFDVIWVVPWKWPRHIPNAWSVM